MFWDCPYAQNMYLLVQIKKFEIGLDSVLLGTYNKENEIFRCISTIMKSHLLACNVQEKYLTQLNGGTRYYTIKIQRN